MIGSVPLQYPTRLIWQRRHRSVRIYAWHGLMLSALLSLQEIGLVIEALALDYNAGGRSNPTRDKFKLQKAVG
jgi:hypothetical protein